MTERVRRGLAAGSTALLLALATGGCHHQDDAGPAAGPSSPSTSAAAVPTLTQVGTVTGRLPRQARDRLVHQVGEVVDRWVHAAYVDGDYPRHDFSASWPGFTSGARRLAHRDRALMSNQDIGDRIDGSELRRSSARLDVLAVKQHAVGVTARVLVGFRTTGDVERTVRVQGRLYLTHTDGGWRVFGYDVTKGAR